MKNKTAGPQSFPAFHPGRKLMWLPWLLVLLDSLLTFLAGTSDDGCAMLLPYFAAYPFGILLDSLAEWIGNSFIITNPDNPTTRQYLLWDRMELTIFLIGGALWFFFIGLILRWLILRAIGLPSRPKQANE
jgi:hypothetical protein